MMFQVLSKAEKIMQRQTLCTILSTLTLLLTTSCTQKTNTPASSPVSTPSATTKEVNLYSSRHYDSDEALFKAFTAKTGIKVNLIEGKAEELIERMKSEGKNSPADILITVDVGNLWRADQAGILQPIDSPILQQAIPKNLRSEKNDWFAFSKRARVIIYNNKKVKPSELSSYEDLASPKWKGRLCLRSSSNIYNQSLVASKIAELGPEKTEAWLKGLVANFSRPPEGNDTNQIEAVASGACDVSLVNHYYLARFKDSKTPDKQKIVANIGVFFPDQAMQGTHINISGAGIATNAPHKDSAIAFLEYLVTPEAQDIFANQNYEYPILKGMKPNPVVATFGTFKESPLQIYSYGENNPQAVQLMDKVGWK